MGKATSYTDIRGLTLKITFNEPEADLFIPMMVRVMGDVTTEDGGRKRLHAGHEIGNLVESPLTFKQIYNNVPAVMQPFLKDFVEEAIDLDVTE